jgi:hypothetical protein
VMFALYGDKSTYVHSSLLSIITYHPPEKRGEIRRGVMLRGAMAPPSTVACKIVVVVVVVVVVVGILIQV